MEAMSPRFGDWLIQMTRASASETRSGHFGHRTTSRICHLAEFQEVFDQMLPNAVKRAFGRPGGADNEFCLKTGLKRHTTEEVVNRYLDEMKGYMLETGLKFPALSQFEKLGAELSPSTSEILRSVQ